ncbi:MAG TPA: hypothetical protein VGW78_05295 [Candidatus Babeliales bacterium]|jgi:hypothetical protein|nr:hypothetical protein [Candidatus Babeliales bacterium]
MNINNKICALSLVIIVPLCGMQNENTSTIIDPYNIAVASSLAWLANTNTTPNENIKTRIPIIGGKLFIPKKMVLSTETSNALRQMYAPIPDAANMNLACTVLEEIGFPSRESSWPTTWSKLHKQMGHIGTSAGLAYAKEDLLHSPLGEYVDSCSDYLQTYKEQVLGHLPNNYQKGTKSIIDTSTHIGSKILHGVSAYGLQERLYGSSCHDDTSAPDLTLAFELGANVLNIYSKHTMPEAVQIATGIGKKAARFNTMHALYDPQGNTKQENVTNIIAGAAGATFSEMVERSNIGKSYKTWIANSRFKEHQRMLITLCSIIIRFVSQEIIRMALRKCSKVR